MLNLFKLFRATPTRRPRPPRRAATHDYTTQWDGHRVINDAQKDTAFVTGEGLRNGDLILLPEGRYRMSNVCGCDYSDLFLVTLEPER